MVTGRPCMMRNSSTKSWRCIGSSLASALRRPSASSAMIISRTATMRSLVEEHVLGAAEADALGAEAARGLGVERRLGVGAHVHGAATSSAQPISVAKSPESSGWMVGTSPSMTSPVEPSMVMTLAEPHDMVADRDGARRGSRCGDRRRRRRKAGPCRAPPPRRGWSCRRARSGRPWPHACRGCPRGWSRCAPGSPPRPLPARLSASSAEKTTSPEAAPGEAGRPRARSSSRALGSSVGWSSWSSDAGSMRRDRLVLADQPVARHVDGDLERGLGGALAGARLQHVEPALLHRELDVLHVAVMAARACRRTLASSANTSGITSSMAGSDELVGLLAGDGQMLRRADAGDHVLALGVDQNSP